MPPQENLNPPEPANPESLELATPSGDQTAPASAQAAPPEPAVSRLDNSSIAAPPAQNTSLDQTAPSPSTTSASADTSEPSSTETNTTQASRFRSLPGRIFRRGSIYAWIFGVSVVLVGLVIYAFAIRPAKSGNGARKVTSLTDAQIAQFKNSATLVGSPKQTLDVQSNAIFDNQVLLRNDLSVAGSIKSGGAGSFQSITIGGAGDFNDIHINNSLGVVGTATFQGQVNVQKNLVVSGSSSLGTVSASQLTVGNLVLNGDISVTRHITTAGGTPSKSDGTALGGGGTASLSGTDTAGSIVINTGSGPVAGILVNVTFAVRFASTPHVIITPIGSSAAGLSYYVNRTATGFSIGVNNAPPPGANFGFDYIVLD